jgi:hypothetical protein
MTTTFSPFARRPATGALALAALAVPPFARRPATGALALAALAVTALRTGTAAAEAPPPIPPVAPGPPTIERWDADQPAPAGYHLETRPRMGLVIGGSVLLGTTYTPMAVAGVFVAVSGEPAGALGAIPVAGPFVVAGLINRGSSGGDGGGAGALITSLLIVDGLAQTAGAAMLIAGLASPRRVAVRDRGATVTVMPTPLSFGKNSAGFGIRGTF